MITTHDDSYKTSNDGNETPVENNRRNYGNSIQGPWVLIIIKIKKSLKLDLVSKLK